MTSLVLKKTAVSATSATHTPLVPTVSAYGTWYSCGSADWTAAENDIIQLTQWASYEVTSLVCDTDERLVVQARASLFDVTLDLAVPCGIAFDQPFDQNGVKQIGNLLHTQTFNERFITGIRGILTPGHEYSWSLDIQKVQVTGTPTCTLTVLDSSAFGTASKII